MGRKQGSDHYMTDNIVVLFRKSVSKITAIAFLGSAMIFSTAASAEAAAEASIPLDVLKSQAAESALGEADPAFKMIFNNWAGQGKQEQVKLTIPSRKPVKDFTLTSSYGFRSDPFKGRRASHKGLDMAGPIGTPIYATADGIIGRAQWLGGYGKYIEIEENRIVIRKPLPEFW